jgi:hypothetical protein
MIRKTRRVLVYDECGGASEAGESEPVVVEIAIPPLLGLGSAAKRGTRRNPLWTTTKTAELLRLSCG